MKAFIIAVGLVFAVAPAYAASPNLDTGRKTDKKDPAREKQEDEAYKSSLQRIQAKEAPSSDPWGSLRGDGNASSQSKSKNPTNPAR